MVHMSIGVGTMLPGGANLIGRSRDLRHLPTQMEIARLAGPYLHLSGGSPGYEEGSATLYTTLF